MPVAVGDEAPDFELPGSFDRETGQYRMYRLSKALTEAPVVMHFFPSPFTSGCQAQMCRVRDERHEMYDASGVQVWGVTGHYPYTIRAWAKENGFTIPILADYEHEVSERYVGTYEPEKINGLRHISKRAVVAVNTEGVVRFAMINPEPWDPVPDERVQEAIASVS